MSRPDQGRPAVPPVGAGHQPGWPTSAPPHPALGPADPAEAGPYRLEAVLGAGGMGRVYLGRTPAGSAVAVKVVHREYAGDASFRKRFEQEVAAARRVQGLYTVPVVDADLQADEPWLATAYVPGPSLQHAVAEGGPLPADAALGLIARVAEALQSIHAADVIHRDLKPSNIILTAEGPKVIDFGIARAADVTAVTATGMRTGTPAYLAPEYIRGQSVTEAGDVFALGVVAHFAATGRLAFGGGTDHSVIYRILEQAPDLDGCPEPVRSIAARCLEKDPEQRPTPAEVVEQCRRVSTTATTHADTLVDAAPPGPGPVAPGRPLVPGSPDAGTVTALSPGSAPAAPTPPTPPTPPAAPGSPGAGTPQTPTQATREPARGVAPGGPGVPAGEGTLPHPPSPDPRTGPTPRLSVLIGAVGVGVTALVIILIALTLPPSTPERPDLPYPAFAPEASLTISDKAHRAEGMAFSPDGKTLATGRNNLAPGSDSKVNLRLWDVAGHKSMASLSQHDEVGNTFGALSMVFSPDGKRLAVGDQSGKVGLWDVAERRMIRYFDGIGDVNSVVFGPDGKTLISGDPAGTIYLWDPNSPKGKDGELGYITQGHGVTQVALSPDGKLLASAGDDPDNIDINYKRDDTVVLWDMAHVTTHTPHTTLHTGDTVTSVAFSPDGKTLATSHHDGKVRLWDVAGGHRKATISSRYGKPIEDVAFSPDGRTLAATVAPGVWLWDVASRTPRAILMSRAQDSDDVVEEVAFSPDGRLVAGNDHEKRTVRLWKTPHNG